VELYLGTTSAKNIKNSGSGNLHAYIDDFTITGP